MSRRRVRWLIAVLLIIEITLGAWWWFHPRLPYGVTKRSFAEIQPGMTLEEVEKIIGLPGTVSPKGFLVTADWRDWYGPAGGITVWLDRDGIVVGKQYVARESPGFL